MDTVIEHNGRAYGRVKRWLDGFNERMGIYAISRQTYYNWKRGVKPDPRILSHALNVYPEGDWRHEWAKCKMQENQGV